MNVDFAKKVQKLLKLSLVSTTFSLVQKERFLEDLLTTYGRSPVWIRWCFVRDDDFVKDEPQISVKIQNNIQLFNVKMYENYFASSKLPQWPTANEWF